MRVDGEKETMVGLGVDWWRRWWTRGDWWGTMAEQRGDWWRMYGGMGGGVYGRTAEYFH